MDNIKMRYQLRVLLFQVLQAFPCYERTVLPSGSFLFQKGTDTNESAGVGPCQVSSSRVFSTRNTDLVYMIRTSMEVCYINTGHPDFLSGHQAIAMVNEQMHPKPPQPVGGPESGNTRSTRSQTPVQQQPPQQLQTSSSFTAEGESNSFFGSFFNGPKKSKKSNPMEAVMVWV